MNLNWDAIGAVGEVGGAIAVVVTLIYLGRQLNANTRSLNAQSVDSSFSERNDLVREMQALDGVGSSYRKVIANERLTEDEAWEMNFFYLRVFSVSEKQYYFHKIGAADDSSNDSFNRFLMPLLTSNFFSEWWSLNKELYSVDFQKFVEANRGT